MVMLGKSVQEPSGCWTKPTNIEEVNLEDIHGHIFTLAGNGRFIAYEYRERPLFDMADVKPEFFHDVIQYLRSNNLENLLGLQVLSNEPQEKLAEFVLKREAGTVMLRGSEANYRRISRVTGWSFKEKNGVISCKGNNIHAKIKNSNYYIF
jgi:hypothetical protein